MLVTIQYNSYTVATGAPYASINLSFTQSKELTLKIPTLQAILAILLA